MNPWIVAAWVVTAGSVVGLAGALLWMRSRAGRTADEDRNLLEGGRSFDRYQVMERLLSHEDAVLLASQPSLTKGIRQANARRWKRDSVRIFRVYLAELGHDFRGLHAEARRLVAESHAESPHLASILVRQQITFFSACFALEVRLTLFALGIGTVDVAPLLQMVEKMRLDLSYATGELAPTA